MYAFRRMDNLDSYFKYYKKVNDTVLVEIQLPGIDHIYNPLDPSPYPEKSLDKTIEEYITEGVRDFPLKTDLRLVFYLPIKDMQTEAARKLVQTVQNHFRYRAAQTKRVMRDTFVGGRISLAIGISFLALTLLANLIIAKKPDTVINEIIRNSLLIIGWVAMWQPISIFFYAWRPFRQTLKVYQKICIMEISVLPSEGNSRF
jgi:hypothetical protein